MEIFNLFAGVCSIMGLFVSLFVASKVTKITNEKGETLLGSGTQKTAKEKAAFADNHSTAAYNDYRGATINGEIDEYPVLNDNTYLISNKTSNKYQSGVSKDTCNLMSIGNENTFCFSIDFSKVKTEPDSSRWIGYSVMSLPMKDWRSFVNEDYKLCFNHVTCGTINELWIEFTNKSINKKIYREKVVLSSNKSRYQLSLKQFKSIINDWKSVDEICFVFFPEDCVGMTGTVCLADVVVEKE